jgi:hypothetical protein
MVIAPRAQHEDRPEDNADLCLTAATLTIKGSGVATYQGLRVYWDYWEPRLDYSPHIEATVRCRASGQGDQSARSGVSLAAAHQKLPRSQEPIYPHCGCGGQVDEVGPKPAATALMTLSVVLVVALQVDFDPGRRSIRRAIGSRS